MPAYEEPPVLPGGFFSVLKQWLFPILCNLFLRLRNACIMRNFSYQSRYQNDDSTPWTGRSVIQIEDFDDAVGVSVRILQLLKPLRFRY